MCNETLMRGAKYFLIPAPKLMKPIKKKILLKRGFQTDVYFYLPDTFTFKLEPTEVQDAAKRPNFEF